MEEKTYELSNCELTRIDVDDEHYYYGRKNGTDEKVYFLSVTRVLDIAAPFPESLRDYLRITDYEEQKERLRFTGDRGTKLHSALQTLMERESLNLKSDYVSTYEKDAIVAFIRMMRFLSPGKYSTEMVVADPELRLAGTLDFKGTVEEWKLEALLNPTKYLDVDSDGDFQLKDKWLDLPNKKRICIIIDWKFTGRNSYSHKVQAGTYRVMNNKSQKGRKASRAFIWRYSPRHKAGFDFQESLLGYKSFKRIYDTCIDYLGEFPDPPTLRKYPESVRLYQPKPVNKLKEIS